MKYNKLIGLIAFIGFFSISTTYAGEGQWHQIPKEIQEKMKAAGIPTPEELHEIIEKVKSENDGKIDHEKVVAALEAAGFKAPQKGGTNAKPPLSEEEIEAIKEKVKKGVVIKLPADSGEDTEESDREEETEVVSADMTNDKNGSSESAL
ncbi:MAG: hypothetical protein M9962_10080 [Oligoflexia bacterium]|nr:hypothetical protein [Oligoflexia bacterium]